MWSVICTIALRTNNVIRTSEPGVAVELFAKLLDCTVAEAIERFHEYARYSLFIEEHSSMTVEELLMSFAKHKHCENDIDLFFATVDPIVECNRGIVHVRDRSLLLGGVLSLLDVSDTVELLFLFPADAGQVFRNEDAGYDYRFHSHERCHHNEPHLHVTFKHEESGTFMLRDGSMRDGNMREGRQSFVRKKIMKNQSYLMSEWNRQTDGLEIDLNYIMGSLQMQE